LTHSVSLYIHFRLLLPPNEILPRAKFTLRPVLRSPIYGERYCTALEQWASAKHCGVEQRAPSIFGRAAITLGIGRNSSYVYCLLLFNFCSLYQVIRVSNRKSVDKYLSIPVSVSILKLWSGLIALPAPTKVVILLKVVRSVL